MQEPTGALLPCDSTWEPAVPAVGYVRYQVHQEYTKLFQCLKPLPEGTPNCFRLVVILSSYNRDFSGSIRQQLYFFSDQGIEYTYSVQFL